MTLKDRKDIVKERRIFEWEKLGALVLAIVSTTVASTWYVSNQMAEMKTNLVTLQRDVSQIQNTLYYSQHPILEEGLKR